MMMNEQNQVMKFTKTEWEIIKHRLAVSDCIWEVMSDCEPCPITETEEELHRRCGELYDYTQDDEVDISDNLTAQIIYDCCDGSTFFYGMPANLRARYTKAAYSLERKLSIDIPLEYE
tara:strand:+ start:940 stop:1293 length:354 start_codon:yes stop_codon:yes gene_type:complete